MRIGGKGKIKIKTVGKGDGSPGVSGIDSSPRRVGIGKQHRPCSERSRMR